MKDNKNKKISIFYKRDKVNDILIPIFLKKEFFELKKKNNKLFKYDIKPINKSYEIEKIFNHRT